MFRKILKWIGIGIVALLVLLIVISTLIYLAFPVIEMEVSREVSQPPEAMFNAFMDFDHWYDYWDIDELFPPEGEVGVGTIFNYAAIEGYATLIVTEYVPGEMIRLDMSLEGVPGDGYFIMRFEPTATGSRVTASNHIEFDGILRVPMAILAMVGGSNGYYDNMISEVEAVALSRDGS